jgi:putative SOS response-associated peptidase YedK
MCGRFVLLTDLKIITESFNIKNVDCEYRPGNNISPGQQIGVVLRKNNQNSLSQFSVGINSILGQRLFHRK